MSLAETEGLGLIPYGGAWRTLQQSCNTAHRLNSLEKNERKLLGKRKTTALCIFCIPYAAVTDSKNVMAYCDHGMKVPALVMSGNV